MPLEPIASKPMLEILLEDNHCLAVNKPAGLLAQGDETGEISLVDEAREYIRAKYQKPGNVFIGLVHRLDRPTSGVTLLARTSKGADRLAAQFRDGSVEKVYWAIVEGNLEGESGEWHDTLLKDERRNVVSIVPPGTPGGKPAGLGYRVLGTTAGRTWLEVRPVTGRSHQIRVQLAERGFPIVGDRKYGATSTLLASDGGGRVALHAQSITFRHPTRPESISVVASVPADWPSSRFSTKEGPSGSSMPGAFPGP
ncbi:RluA family pseudouridine synthase [Singulisphaera sp. PoT]|uniref:RluA family pseudouridine synthase n=1 Tax=Singulisphaera sp. PoT TaxID=3411797 RepID=UPI003BF54714